MRNRLNNTANNFTALAILCVGDGMGDSKIEGLV